MGFFQKQKPLKERPENERRPSLKDPVDRQILIIFTIVAGVALGILIILLLYVKSKGII